MRLFTGIDLPSQVRERLDVRISHLRPHAHLKWSPAYNLHVTLKFIGNWPDERVSELHRALKQLPSPAPITIGVRGLGWFPNPKAPRVFWAGIEASPGLAELAAMIEAALVPLGVAPETRPYAPHLTLARIKEPVPLQHLRSAIDNLKSTDFGSFTPACFHLYRSEPGHTGSIYTKLQEYPLPLK